MIIGSAAPGDLAPVQRICADVLDLEPDATELPAILAGAGGRTGLVARAGNDVVGACFGSLRSVPGRRCRGHVDLLAVARQAAGSGVGRSLLRRMEQLLAGQGAVDILLAGNPPVYLWPGVDARYTVMTCLAARAGYDRYAEAVDMAVSLQASSPQASGPPALARQPADLPAAGLDYGPADERVRAAGLTVRRATGAESDRLVGWLRDGPWGHSSWPEEVRAALARQPAGCHVACREERYVGFACHGSVRRGWFGPMGTLEAERGLGIGSVLLKRCLSDMKAAGHQTARIGWVGPVQFYVRTVGARVERVYWLYRKTLSENPVR